MGFLRWLGGVVLVSSAAMLSAQSTLQEGDLLFQDLNCGALCDAIEAVTEGVNQRDFSHCAMVVRVGDSLVVVEAIGDRVQYNSLSRFFKRSGDTAQVRNILVGRVNPEYQGLIPKAAEYAKSLVAKPYDDLFLPDNDAWYCSEVLYDAFRVASGEAFFELSPMTFKDPGTGNFFPAWVSYYQQWKAPIPEGVPGLNPGSISRSSKIHILPLDRLAY